MQALAEEVARGKRWRDRDNETRWRRCRQPQAAYAASQPGVVGIAPPSSSPCICVEGKVSHAIERRSGLMRPPSWWRSRQNSRSGPLGASVRRSTSAWEPISLVLAIFEHLDEVVACERLLACETEPFQHGGASNAPETRIG